MAPNHVSSLNTDITDLASLCINSGKINPELYSKYDVKRGLRDINGKGVLAGLTEISEIQSAKEVDGKTVPCDGELYYRGYNIYDIVRGFIDEKRFGFEETVYLLLFGDLPNLEQLDGFRHTLSECRSLPRNFVRDIIMKSPSRDLMNNISRSVLCLFSYDKAANDISIPNVLRQSLELIARLPLISVYSYHSKRYSLDGQSLIIHKPKKDYSTAENILHMLRPDSKFTRLEAVVLDLALVLHAEHGGGNNSTFTTHVVTSSGTDTYSAISAAMGSLKGPKHGGANIKVTMMFDDIKRNVSDWSDRDAVKDYLRRMLNKEVFDHAGLIYGMGHAVYSISDPRANIFKNFVSVLAEEKGKRRELALYNMVEGLAPEVIAEQRHIYKGVSANVDFYSGFVYSMLEIPPELYTPLFAIARIAGWSAHRIEELTNEGKIIRPAYRNIHDRMDYVPMSGRGK